MFEIIAFKLNRIIQAIIGFVLFIMLSLVILQVLFRYVLGLPLAWTDELSRYLMTWLIFLGASVASFEGSHIGITVFMDKLPQKIRFLVAIGTNIMIACFLLLILYQSIPLMKGVLLAKSPVLQVSMAIPYLSVPVGCLLVFLQTVLFTLKYAKKSIE